MRTLSLTVRTLMAAAFGVVSLTAGGVAAADAPRMNNEDFVRATACAAYGSLPALAQELNDWGAQVLVVTHSPQVAAFGAQHWRVEKRVTDGQTLSTVLALDPEERIEEIARMLAGDTVTEAARAAARALLQG